MTGTNSVRLDLEFLDRRDMPSQTVSVVGDSSYRTLCITNDGQCPDTRVASNYFGDLQISHMVGGQWQAQPGVYSGIDHIRFIGGTGDDKFVNSTSLFLQADGGGGNDEITVGDGFGELHGGPGNDILRAGFGGSKQYGDAGDDRLYGGSRWDGLEGGSGNDILRGGEGGDYLIGGAGNDSCYGEGGEDDIHDDGWDSPSRIGETNYLSGGSGFDTLVGGVGNDILDGGQDGIADTLIGNFGADTFVREYTVKRLPPAPINLDEPKDFTRSESDRVIDPSQLPAYLPPSGTTVTGW